MNSAVNKVLSLFLLLSFCGITEVATAMSAPQADNSAAPQASVQGNQPSSPDAQNTGTPPASNNLPDSPSAAQANTQNQNANQAPDQQPQEPRGTAAAQAAKTHGGAASKPAGAAIAPAKQRRTRSLLIKLGIIAGAGAALGTVYGLSKASPSRPPGAR
jgi:hypothetical protein